MKSDLLTIIKDSLNNKGSFDRKFCPHCHSDKIIKNGKYKERQLFTCNACGKNFNSLTNTPMAMSHMPEKWPLFIECILKGFSLRTSAAEIDVSYVTLFYWRHKLMRALKQDDKKHFGEYVEADDTFLAYSEKGNRKILGRKPKKTGNKYLLGEQKKVFLLVAADHSEHLFLKASASRAPYVNLICEALTGIVCPKTTFCSGPKSFYEHYVKLKGIKQYFRINRCVRTEEHNIDLANGYRNVICAWLKKFQGVASKYLNNYLSLFNCLRKSNFDESETGLMSFIEDLRCANEKNTYRSIRELAIE